MRQDAHVATQKHKQKCDLRDRLEITCSISTDEEQDAPDESNQAEYPFDNDYGPMDFEPTLATPPAASPGPKVDMTDEGDASSATDYSDEEDDILPLEDLPFLHAPQDQDFAPFPSRLIFLLHTIASNPRCPMSVEQVKLILMLLKWLGYKETPSYSKYRRDVESACQLLGSGTQHSREVVGREGHRYVVTSIAHELARDFSSPEVRKHMSLYPRKEPQIRDMMDGDWDGSHAFVDEPVELVDYRVFLVSAWVQQDGQLHGLGRRCVPSADNERFDVIASGETMFPVSSIRLNGPQLAQAGYKHVQWQNKAVKMVCPLRGEARGLPVYSVFLKIFCDDLSGVRSKRWDKHHGVYYQNANLSSQYLGRDEAIKLFCASPSASAGELMESFVEELECLKTGFICMDAQTGRNVLVRPTFALCVCDNPMAAELVGIVGMAGNYPCKCCNAGGSRKNRKTVKGLEGLLKPGTPRTSRSIRRSLRRQLWLAAHGRVAQTKRVVEETGVSDPWTRKSCEALIKKHKESGAARHRTNQVTQEALEEANADRPWAALLDYPDFDPSVQLPLELLHVVLLGLAKYLWRATMLTLQESDKLKLAARLTDANVDGLGIDGPLRGGYMIRHAFSLNGKDFRALLMVVPSVLPSLAEFDEDEDILRLSRAWLAAARLAAALYVDSVPRQQKEQYETYLHRCVSSVYESLAHAQPTMLSTKPKLHLLCHASSHFAAFGPLGGNSAERFEAFNSIVRAAAIHSNRLMPSRDIANRLLRQQDMRYILGGGSLFDHTSTGSSLRVLLRTSAGKRLLKMYGLESSKRQTAPGTTVAAKPPAYEKLRGAVHQHMKSVVLPGTLDVIKVDSAVLLRSPINRSRDEERWTTLLLVSSIMRSEARTVIRGAPLWPAHDQEETDLDSLFHVAIGDEEEDVTVDVKEVLSVLNIQHDCTTAGCQLKHTKPKQTQKRGHLGDNMSILHSDLGVYIASFTQFRSASEIWPHVRTGPEVSSADIAKTAISTQAM
ncbi:hypothetical protein V8E36_003494 [Tilletia maclaganii]